MVECDVMRLPDYVVVGCCCSMRLEKNENEKRQGKSERREERNRKNRGKTFVRLDTFFFPTFSSEIDPHSAAVREQRLNQRQDSSKCDRMNIFDLICRLCRRHQLAARQQSLLTPIIDFWRLHTVEMGRRRRATSTNNTNDSMDVARWRQ